jgi:alkylation response protein AidB-like acyl-CoA dehydrogenase
MGIRPSSESYDFRREVQSFLRDVWTLTNDPAEIREFRRKAVAAGYLYRSVPAIYGGSEQPYDLARATIIRQEFARAGAPREISGNGVNMVVPTLLEHGTDDQKANFIRPTIDGEIEWAQGYSEPQAGSDLASLRTRAERVGGEWVINGHKIWSSHADRCQFMFLLARTTPRSQRHEGITYLLLEMKQPGVEIRPIKAINGEERFCEVFLTDARTPVEWTVGPVGEGWRVSKSTLKHERVSIGGVERIPFEQLLKLARIQTIGGRPAIEHPRIRERLATIDGAREALRHSQARQLAMRTVGQEPGLIDLVSKLFLTNILHDVSRLARDLMGDASLLQPLGRAGAEKWNNQFMGSLGTAIAGGTSNIQRNIIAERGLNLPRQQD